MAEVADDIIIKCKEGDAAAQRLLYKTCFEPMFRVCLRYTTNEQDAANCYNEAMYTVLSKIKQFEGKGSFMGWVRRIMVNTCINIIKRDKKFRYEEVTGTDNETQGIDPDIYRKLQAAEILHLVQQLPQPMCVVFNLYVMEGYTHAEIGATLGMSPNTSKWHLANAKNELKKKMISQAVNESYKNAY